MINKKIQAFGFLTLILGTMFPQRGLGQGSLIPPGPPGPTMKTLDQIEPRRPIGSLPFAITNSGAYYVTAQVVGAATQDGITISADNVTIDLEGFTLTGVPGALAAIKVNSAGQRLTIKNGSISGWQSGISAAGASHGVFRDLSFSSMGASALDAGGDSSVVGCHAFGSGSDAFKVGPSSAVTDCSAVQNSGNGINVGLSSVVASCNVISNSAAGILTGHFAVVENCHAFFNASAGIAALNGCRFTGCTFGQNGGGGLAAGDNAQVENCTALNNAGVGFLIGATSQIESAKASGNTTSGFWLGADSYLRGGTASNNGDYGIATGEAAHLSDCKSTGNANAGFHVNDSSTIQNCSAQRNESDGILVTSECIVISSTSSGNFNARDAAGIHATGTDNCIKDNHVVSNDRGLSAEKSGNTFLRNIVTNNSLNYSLADDQVMAPTLTKDTISDATNPWSNLTY